MPALRIAVRRDDGLVPGTVSRRLLVAVMTKSAARSEVGALAAGDRRQVWSVVGLSRRWWRPPHWRCGDVGQDAGLCQRDAVAGRVALAKRMRQAGRLWGLLPGGWAWIPAGSTARCGRVAPCWYGVLWQSRPRHQQQRVAPLLLLGATRRRPVTTRLRCCFLTGAGSWIVAVVDPTVPGCLPAGAGICAVPGLPPPVGCCPPCWCGELSHPALGGGGAVGLRLWCRNCRGWQPVKNAQILPHCAWG